MFCITTPTLFAQKITVNEYIDKYSDISVSEMKRSGIPASITLAQGILESGSGNSAPAVKDNNHFGIKCHGWNGAKGYYDDDKKGECFRKYKDVKESYVDHTDFLMSHKRYAFLFDYKSTDYKNWAKGLKKAGYATDPNYAQKLIDYIEKYDLHQYDTGVAVPKKNTAQKTSDTKVKQPSGGKDDFTSLNIDKYQVKETNRTGYITAKAGDTYASLTKELDLMPWQLPKYNDAKASDALHDGQIVYLQPKRKKAERGKNTHTVNANETMYDISQMYAIKLSRLYLLNKMEADEQPQKGDVLNLRKKKKK
jgi:LysM repeat protein